MPAKRIRSEPNCMGDNPIRPFLIKINELPQINERIVRSIHLSCLDSIKLVLVQNSTNFVKLTAFF
jgi:hypothetical protein